MHGKLEGVGTTIFEVVTRRARELGALNLGQGCPDYDIDPRLTELVTEAMRAGHNQYATLEGVPVLRERIALRHAGAGGRPRDPDAEITITLGATEGIFSAIQAFIGPGEEAIAFDPAYDSYEPSVRLAGGRCVRVPLEAPHFRYDWDRVRAAITPRTRVVIFNSPHNPACTVASAADLDALARLTAEREIVVLADEVYEHVVFDGRRHHSVLAHPELGPRSAGFYSFGKTLHATGLRVGYCIAPPGLTHEIRRVHQFNTFCIAHPLQHAIGTYLGERPDWGSDLAAFFGAKRERMLRALAGTGFDLPPAQGTYFQLLGFSAFAPPGDVAFAERLITEAGVATIPLSPFYSQPPPLQFVRMCLAKRDETLDAAAALLVAFARRAGGTA